MGESRGKRVWRYTTRDIADAAGIPLRTVKEHRVRGRFNPDSLESVMLYGAAHINRRLAKRIPGDEE